MWDEESSDEEIRSVKSIADADEAAQNDSQEDLATSQLGTSGKETAGQQPTGTLSAKLPRQRSRFFGYEDENTDSPVRGASTVRETMRRRKTMRQEHLYALMDRANKRHEEAETRRRMADTRKEAIAADWMRIMIPLVFAYRLDRTREIHHAIKLFVRRLAPIARLKQLRLRRKRLTEAALQSPDLVVPTVELLMKDSLLSLFGTAHLRTILPALKPEFFLAGHNLVFQGEEGNECYVMASGVVDVFVRGTDKDGEHVSTWVATKHPGDVIGSIGMISGARRMSRCTCKTNVVAYVIWRKQFLTAGADENVMKSAMVEVRRLHELNIPKIYADAVSGEALSRYPLFRQVDVSVLAKLKQLDLFTAAVYRPGDIVITAGSLSSKMIFVLHGTASVLREKKCTFTQPAVEVFANMSDVSNFASKGKRKEHFADNHAEASKGSTVGTLSACTVIGGPMFLLMEPYQLTVVAQTSLDCLIVESRAFLQVMVKYPSALHQMRRNACEAMAAWIKPMSRLTALQALFPDVAAGAINQLRTSRHHWFDFQPVVVNRGETLDFDASNRDAYIVVGGALEGVDSKGAPVMWPSAPLLFFGNYVTGARVTMRVEAWKISRRNFLSVLRAVLDDDRLGKVYVEMHNQFEARTGKAAQFEEARGISIPNPLLGAQPPAPPPERSAAARAQQRKAQRAVQKRRASTTSTDTDTGNEPSAMAAAQDTARTEDNGHSTESSPPALQPLNSSNGRRRSSVYIVEEGMAPLTTEDSAQEPPPPSSTPPPRSVPVLPSGFGMGVSRVPMQAAIAKAVKHATRNRSPTRSPSPRLPPIPPRKWNVKPPADNHCGTAPMQLSDPYARLFGDTEVAEILRDEGHGAKAPAADKPATARASAAVRHHVNLDAVRKTATARRRQKAATM
jgi:CRP-like cAMP-binding protein